MTRFERVVAILDQAIGGPTINIGAHGPFWRNLTRAQFVAMKVFGRQLITKGDGSTSILIKALKGEVPFGSDLRNPPAGATIPRMPDGFPAVADNDIEFIQKWIDDGCPEDSFVPTRVATRRNLDSSIAGGPKPTLAWHPTNAPKASSRYDDVWFLDPQHGWAVNSNGQILYTPDGGVSWHEQLHEPSVYMRCVAFASPNRGWVGTITEGKILYSSHDGGSQWSLVTNLPANAPVAVCGIWVVNESVVYVAGSNHPEQPVRMMRTIDGGKSWTAWDMRTWADNLIDVYFTSPERGWVVGGRTDDRVNPGKPKLRPVVLYTEDGGRTWFDRVNSIRDQFPLGEWGWKIYFLNERVGFISLQNYDSGAILVTSDGGLTWARRPINDSQMNANLEGIGFIDEKTGWVGGWGDRPKVKRTSSATSDGGLTWRDANEIGRTINRFRFLGDPLNVGYAAGETVYKYAPSTVVAGTDAEQFTPQDGPRLFDSVLPLTGTCRTVVSILIPADVGRFTLRIFDTDGPLVRVLVDEMRPEPGRRTLTWDRTDHSGNLLAPRSYIWRATVDGISESRHVLISDDTAT